MHIYFILLEFGVTPLYAILLLRGSPLDVVHGLIFRNYNVGPTQELQGGTTHLSELQWSPALEMWHVGPTLEAW